MIIGYVIPGCRTPAAVALALAILLAATCTTAAPQEDHAVLMRQHFIHLLTGMEPLPERHALAPLERAPLLATSVYILFQHDEGMLDRLYPAVRSRVLDRLTRESVDGVGLLPGDLLGGSGGSYLCPALNSMANLELHSLRLIAARTGRHEDAIELAAWSREYTETVSSVFYDTDRDFFFPIDGQGYYTIGYAPEQLLPLLMDAWLGESFRVRLIDKVIHHARVLGSTHGTPVDPGSVWLDPDLRPALEALLRTIPRVSASTIDGLLSSLGEPAAQPEPGDWSRFWSERGDLGGELFPGWSVVSTVLALLGIIEEESLIEGKKLSELESFVAALRSMLDGDLPDLATYLETTAAINGLLARFSAFSTNILSDADRWKAVDEHRWAKLSPRTKKLVTEGARAALDELMRAKVTATRRLAAATGLSSELRLPLVPIVLGGQTAYDAVLRSARDTIDVSQVYLQIGDSRWRISDGHERVTLAPERLPFSVSRPLPLPPGARPGIHRFHAYFDFLAGGRRVELHHDESVSLTKGYNVSIGFPRGRRIDGEGVFAQIEIRYRPDHDLQGAVEGSFLRELQCTPDLPARFLLSSERESTTLPLVVGARGDVPPGRYPFSLSVFLDGKQIASFDEYVVKPIRWFHLGPLDNAGYLHRNALEYQDDLFRIYKTAEGDALKWRVIPAGAIGPDGAINPDRLYGGARERSAIFYTVLASETRRNAQWRIGTGNPASLWINGVQIFREIEERGDGMSGVVEIRRGPNTVLIAVSWRERPGTVLFELVDTNGLPIAGLGNDVEEIIDGFARLTARADDEPAETPPSDSPREVTVTLVHRDADEVSLIGSFNNWDPSISPMTCDDAGRWSVTLLLRPGKYPYKFLVDRKSKMTDPAIEIVEPDGFGGLNSILTVR